jgi:hypothetical protein
MMGNLDLLQSSYNRAPQFNNLWDFTLEDWDSSVYSISRFNMISTSLPFVVELETESSPTGKNYYTDFKYPTTFSIELRENTSFTVYEYFKNWLLKVFDPINGNFISSSESKTKTGTIYFYSYKLKPSAYKLFSAEYVTEKIKNLQAVASQTLIEQAKRKANAALPYPMSMLASQGASIVSSKVRNGLNSIMPDFGDMFEEVVTKTFTIENVRLVGLSDTTLNYEDGGQLTLTANFVADRFYDNEMKSNVIDRPTFF